MDTLHLKAPASWLNDPNAFIYYKGQYHLFYQHFPFSTRWGTMHWGHAVTDDLVHWEHKGVALFPSKYFDANGIFSGGAFEKDGKMLLYYTGVRYYAFEPENSHVSLNDVYECTQAMVESEDGFTFDNYDGKKVILPVIYDDNVANFNHCRDPKVWKENDTYYMVLGSTYKMETGRVLVLKSDDAVNWEIQSVLTDPKFGRILECPDVFKIGDQYLFLISPMYIIPPSEGYTSQSMIGTIDFDPEKSEISNLGEFEFIDLGGDLYATQSCEDEEGRRVMVVWLRMPQDAINPADGKAYNGMMSIPRVIDYEDGKVYYRIHPNVRKHFDKELTRNQIKLFDACGDKPYLIETSITNGQTISIGGFRIAMKNNTIMTDRGRVFVKNTGLKNRFYAPSYSDYYRLTIVVEPNVIEVYIDDGKYCITNTVYNLGHKLKGNIERLFISSENE